jgi:hypothetical protein
MQKGAYADESPLDIENAIEEEGEDGRKGCPLRKAKFQRRSNDGKGY